MPAANTGINVLTRVGSARTQCPNGEGNADRFLPFSSSLFCLRLSCSQQRILRFWEYVNEHHMLMLSRRRIVFTAFACVECAQISLQALLTWTSLSRGVSKVLLLGRA